MASDLVQIGDAVALRLRQLDELIDSARSAVQDAQAKAVEQLEPWLNKKDAARYLNMSVSTLETRLASRNPPPHTHDGGRLRFKPSELDEWLRQWAVVPPGRRVGGGR